MLTLSTLTSYLPADLDFAGALKFIAIFAGAMLIIGAVARMLLGQQSGLNRALSAAMGILCIYAVTIVVYTFNPYDLSKFLAPLPFATFGEDVLTIFSFRSAEFPAICTQLVSMILLAFLVNLLDSILPKGQKNMLLWFILRAVMVVLAMGLHYLVCWGFNLFLPGVLAAYAPTILLVALVGSLVIGLLNVILSLVLTVINPIFGAMYAFFFSNLIGKQLGKAVLTTAILCGVVYALEHFGYGVIAISAAALQAYIPAILALLVLWYVTGHIF